MHLARGMNKVHDSNSHVNGTNGSPTVPPVAPKPAPAKLADGSAGVSRVNFQTVEGIKLCGMLAHFTRQSATFEFHGPATILRAAEALTDFQIEICGQTAYSGRAVIANLLDGGSNTFCEVTLDENLWAGKINLLETPAATGGKGHLELGFKEFLQNWQSLYKISPEYKLALVDMQTYFTDLKLWLNQLEISIQAVPEIEQPALERKIIAEVGRLAFPTFAALFERFELAAKAVDKKHLPPHQALVKRMLHPLILCSPFMHRIYSKPLGYAGDYEMVNMILRDPHEGDSLFAKLLNVFILGQVPGEAHRNRVIYLVHRLVEEVGRMAQQGKVCRIYNLGCGPAGEVQQFLRAHDLSQHAQFTLLDADDETLRNTGKLLESIKSKHNRRTPLKLVKKSVHQLLKPSDRNKSAGEKYDYIYSAGLFDYLTDQVGRTIIELTYNLLAPGGLLLITNVDPVNPIKNIMDHIYDWPLIYRDGRQLAELAARLPADASIAIRAEYTSANVILEVRKPSLNP
ncbi:MAG TPA: class I SAM-dependent methyltransferase [Verrucomicrobiae bacterium]|jgi:extracellular factor (EF) 3-hydroxypalmitic acid methyl ester biosynthesis protein